MMITEIYNYLKLSDEYATSGQPSADQVADIAAQGFQVLVNLGLSEAEYALEDERAVVESLGMTYVHLPVLWEGPTEANLRAFYATLDDNRYKKVFVHCAANMRVSVFTALYRIQRLGWEPDRALTDVRQIWVPNATWQGFIDKILKESG
jgi:uncharacterized protein (TIGR01244 family)